jgi:Protein of unknown function (DUF3667)
MSLPRPSPTSPHCLNCGHLLGLPRPHFCGACGQETNVQAPTLREFAQQFGGAYFSTEGALWRTLKLLVRKPGELTRLYLAGQRKHYVLPLRLVLSVALVMLLLLRATGTLDLVGTQELQRLEARPEPAKEVRIEFGGARAGLRGGVYFCQGFPDWVCTRLKRNLDSDLHRMMQNMRVVNERVVANAGAIMFVLMPAFAAGLVPLYRNRGLRYTEHLVFTLHLHAFWALVLAAMALSMGWTPLVVAGAITLPAYALLAMHRVYGGRWWLLLLRFVLLTSAHAFVVAVTVLASVLLAMLV